LKNLGEGIKNDPFQEYAFTGWSPDLSGGGLGIDMIREV